jgi:hypothetical protein
LRSLLYLAPWYRQDNVRLVLLPTASPTATYGCSPSQRVTPTAEPHRR